MGNKSLSLPPLWGKVRMGGRVNRRHPPPQSSPTRGEEVKVWRLIDANANRAREGLRVVEDTARFILERPDASAGLRRLRHQLDEVVRRHYPRLLRHRDVESDPGRGNGTPRHEGGIPALLASNFKRSEEALRVLEEYGRVMSPKAIRGIQAVRYEVYRWEKKLLQS